MGLKTEWTEFECFTWNVIILMNLFELSIEIIRMKLSKHTERSIRWLQEKKVWMSRNSLLEAGAKSEGEVAATGLEPRTT